MKTRFLLYLSLCFFSLTAIAQTGLVSGELNVTAIPTNNGNGTFDLVGTFSDPKGLYFAADVDATVDTTTVALWKGNSYYQITVASANGSELTLTVDDVYSTGFLPTGVYSIGEETNNLKLPGISTSGDSNPALQTPPDLAAKWNYILRLIDQKYAEAAGNGMFDAANQDSSWALTRYYIPLRVDGVLTDKGEFVLQDSSLSAAGPIFHVIAGSGGGDAIVRLGDGVELPILEVRGQAGDGSVTVGSSDGNYNFPIAPPTAYALPAGSYIPVVDENGDLVSDGWTALPSGGDGDGMFDAANEGGTWAVGEAILQATTTLDGQDINIGDFNGDGNGMMLQIRNSANRAVLGDYDANGSGNYLIVNGSGVMFGDPDGNNNAVYFNMRTTSGDVSFGDIDGNNSGAYFYLDALGGDVLFGDPDATNTGTYFYMDVGASSISFGDLDANDTGTYFYMDAGSNITSIGDVDNTFGNPLFQINGSAVEVFRGDFRARDYPNSRDDSSTPANFLYTDANGVLQSAPLAELPDGADGNGLFDAANDAGTIAAASATQGASFTWNTGFFDLYFQSTGASTKIGDYAGDFDGVGIDVFDGIGFSQYVAIGDPFGSGDTRFVADVFNSVCYVDGAFRVVDYPSSRDDSGTTTPTNFFYSDGSGNLLSAPLTTIPDTILITIPATTGVISATGTLPGFWKVPAYLDGATLVSATYGLHTNGSTGDISIQLTDNLTGFFGATLADADTDAYGGAIKEATGTLSLAAGQLIQPTVSSETYTTDAIGCTVTLKIVR